MIWLSGEVALWMLAFVAAAWAAPRRWHPWIMAAFAAAFLGRNDPRSLGAFAGIAVALRVLAPRPGIRGWRVALFVAAVGALLAWTRRVGAAGVPGTATGGVIVLLGLSYYALRAIHVAVERFNGTLRATTLAEDAGFLGFFPALAAGPIHRAREFLHDQDRRRWDPEHMSAGLERILYGYVKVVVLGNYVVSRLFPESILKFAGLPGWLEEYSSLMVVVANGYFQFAGYSDVAIGLARLAGYRLPENFNWPFLATNIRDFWQRWHMSLSQWCRDYVFIPASARFRSPYAGVLLSMLVLALWHEISLRYLLWGLWHAAGIAAWHAFQGVKPRLPEVRSRAARGAMAVACCLLTLHFFAFSYEILRSASLRETWGRFVTIFTLEGARRA